MDSLRMKYMLLGIGLLGGISPAAYAYDFGITIKNDSIIYVADKYGNRVIDYSYCGYKSSSAVIPNLPNRVYVSCEDGDQSARIQKAIDYVSSLPADKNGARGAVLLGEGTFRIDNSLRITASGVALRGVGKDKTVLVKTGVDRGALLYIEGADNRKYSDTVAVTSKYVPVNAMSLAVADASHIKKGDLIAITRPSTQEWIAAVGCDMYGGGISSLGWKPGDNDIVWNRRVTEVNGNVISIDAPLTLAIDEQWGGGFVTPFQWSGYIENSGVENLTLVSDYDKSMPKDESHSWTGVYMDNLSDCWTRNVTFKHFSGSAVIVGIASRNVTVEDCIALSPVSEIGGMRRQTFLTYGQQTLFQRCYSESGINDFAAGYNAAGPNAFVQCDSHESLGFSGSVGAMAPGLLFDVVNIDGNNLSFKNLGQDKNGSGWNTANSLLWQSTASELECYSPSDDAKNRAYGCWGQFSGDGEWSQSNNHIQPRSIFYAQLQARLHQSDIKQARILPLMTNSTSSPTVEQAEKMSKEALSPRLTLAEWINETPFDADTEVDGLLSVDKIKDKKVKTVAARMPEFAIVNGHITSDGVLLAGGKHEVPWWNGSLKRNFIPKSKIHVTRFVPGREGTGLTDRVDSVVSYMLRDNILVLDHNYGLWYERRRDDHERIRRRDGDTWAPYYEQPFARSGEGSAWDGLSKYDLTKPNEWYWSRLREFAGKGAEKGLLLFHENYFQHNILEAGAHWVDCPWRSANNINNTGFNEPVNFTGDKRIFTAESFYDITHPVRRELHRGYIRQCLSALADCPNVVQLISAEFTGPLKFVQFWLDVIREWEQETGKHPMIALSVTKDVQDSILGDSRYADLIDVIDIRYWHYKTDGLYAPEGGKNLAPRQHSRKMKVGKVTYAEAYRAVSEYKNKYPGKAVTYYAQNYPDMAWAVFMAGGSCPVLPAAVDRRMLADAANMTSVNSGTEEYEKLVNPNGGSIIFSHKISIIPIELPDGKYELNFVDSKTGVSKTLHAKINVKGVYKLDTKDNPVGLYWFRKL
jgi:hypothetical protein